jgi:hypothetical protein
MKISINYKFGFLIILLIKPSVSNCLSQNLESQFKEIPLERKLSYAALRTDYYICTGIANGKSMGKTVKDFVIFVGNKHNMAAPGDRSILSAVTICRFVITNYPNGKFNILSEPKDGAVMQWKSSNTIYMSILRLCQNA